MDANADLVRVLRTEVRDSIRFQRAEAVAERMRLAEEFYLSQMRELDERLFDLNADYGASKEELFLLFRDLNELRSRSRDELVSLVDEMKSHLRPAEWPAVWASMEGTQERLEVLFQ